MDVLTPSGYLGTVELRPGPYVATGLTELLSFLHSVPSPYPTPLSCLNRFCNLSASSVSLKGFTVKGATFNGTDLGLRQGLGT